MRASTTHYSRLARRDTVDGEVPRAGRAKVERIDLGLALLSVIALPGIQYTQDEIAAWCGCTNSAIYQIEQKALKKLRNRLRFCSDPRLREMVEQVVCTTRRAA